jgi:hypothetical protein
MNEFGILERRAKLEAEIREAKKSIVNQKRIDRELKKVSSGDRISPFLKRESEKNQVVAASVNLAGSSLELGRAIIQYQSAINESKTDPLKTEKKEPFKNPIVQVPVGANNGEILFWSQDDYAWTILPPPSTKSVLASDGGVPYWLETEECD